ETLDRYGFTDVERPVIDELTAGTSLHELEAAHRDLDPRMVQAIVYALFSCQACEISEAPPMPRAATKSKRSIPIPTALDPEHGPRVGGESVSETHSDATARAAHADAEHRACLDRQPLSNAAANAADRVAHVVVAVARARQRSRRRRRGAQQAGLAAAAEQ